MFNKIKYYLIRLKTLDVKMMIKIAKKIAKNTKKSSIYIFIDMIICSFKYRSGYMDYHEFEFYLLSKEQRKTYITGGINNDILHKYNDRNSWYKLKNKVTFNEIFHKYIKRDWISLNDCTYEEFVKFAKTNKKIIVKPLEEYCGVGIEVIEVDSKTNYHTLYDKLISHKQFLIEEFVKQHAYMNKLYDQSVNTLRIITFYKEGKVYIMKTVLKMGNGGHVDNFSAGGMYTFVDDKGIVYAPAFDKDGLIHEVHPLSKTEIVGFQVPMFDEIKKMVKEAAKLIPEVRYIGWDVAISPDGPLIIEGNEASGVFQLKPSLSKNKIGDLPFYRKYMDI